MAHTVGEVAKLAHVSVRTLHHYDELGILKPSGRTESGYRLYSESDLELLQQVLLYKEIGLSLEEIRSLVADPKFDQRKALVAQRQSLSRQGARVRAMIALVDRTMDAVGKPLKMTKKELFQVFGDYDPAEYEAEVEELWGGTDQYRESARRTKNYSKDDWARIKQEGSEIDQSIAALMGEGVTSDDQRVLDAVEKAREHIDQWFYPCSREMHAGLGLMYVSDPRFTATYEEIQPGMAQYMADATAANAARG